MGTEALDDALTVFAATAPQLRVASAWPITAHGGRGAGAPGPGRRHRPAGWPGTGPGSTTHRARPRPLSEEEWPAALGQADRLPEWLALFEREIADRPVAAVVGEWVPRLLPGSVGAATHGLIRTGHALRGLARGRHAARAGSKWRNGLAFWAASYEELPGPPLLIGHEGVAQALADLPYLPEDAPQAFLISDRVAAVAGIADEFEQAVASLGWTGGAVDAARPAGHRRIGRPTCATRTTGGAIGLLHAVTSPLACELVLPWLAEEDRDAALGYVWQAAAALHVAYDVDRTAPAPTRRGPVGRGPGGAGRWRRATSTP